MDSPGALDYALCEPTHAASAAISQSWSSFTYGCADRVLANAEAAHPGRPILAIGWRRRRRRNNYWSGHWPASKSSLAWHRLDKDRAALPVAIAASGVAGENDGVLVAP